METDTEDGVTDVLVPSARKTITATSVNLNSVVMLPPDCAAGVRRLLCCGFLVSAATAAVRPVVVERSRSLLQAFRFELGHSTNFCTPDNCYVRLIYVSIS